MGKLINSEAEGEFDPEKELKSFRDFLWQVIDASIRGAFLFTILAAVALNYLYEPWGRHGIVVSMFVGILCWAWLVAKIPIIAIGRFARFRAKKESVSSIASGLSWDALRLAWLSLIAYEVYWFLCIATLVIPHDGLGDVAKHLSRDDSTETHLEIVRRNHDSAAALTKPPLQQLLPRAVVTATQNAADDLNLILTLKQEVLDRRKEAEQLPQNTVEGVSARAMTKVESLSENIIDRVLAKKCIKSAAELRENIRQIKGRTLLGWAGFYKGRFGSE